MNINGYTLTSELTSENSGFSKWGFATKGGKQFFIKELITPVYPIDRSVVTPELFESKIKFCRDFENRYVKLYSAINSASCGNLVRIEEFFRCGSRYYLIMEKIEGKSIPVEVIANAPEDKKLLLLKSVAFAFSCLHKWGVVHFDVKQSNILVKQTKAGNYVGKVIDFDAGFTTTEVRDGIELGGDLTYLAPETFLAIRGDDVNIGERADIYSLGLVFHEYFTGHLPTFDHNEYEYPFEAILDGGGVVVDSSIPQEIYEVISKMLLANPEERPSAEEILKVITGVLGEPDIDISTINNGHVSVGSGRLIINMKKGASSIPNREINIPGSSTEYASTTASASTSGALQSEEWFSSVIDL